MTVLKKEDGWVFRSEATFPFQTWKPFPADAYVEIAGYEDDGFKRGYVRDFWWGYSQSEPETVIRVARLVEIPQEKKMDLRHVIWTTEDGKWVRATSKVFSCYPEAYEYYHTMGPSRDRVIMPIGLETAIMAEGINRGIDLMHNTLMKSINSELG